MLSNLQHCVAGRIRWWASLMGTTCAATVAVLVAGCAADPGTADAPDAPARAVLPTGESNPMLADGVVINSGRVLYKTSGFGPERLNPAAPEDSPEAFVDPARFPGAVLSSGVTLTEAQGLNVLARIQRNLQARGLSMENVVTVRVLLDNPPGTDRADYAGWNRAYRQFFANTDVTTGEPLTVPLGNAAPVAPLVRNAVRPSRFAVEVQSLPVRGFLVEVEVDAIYPDGVTPR